MPRTLRHLLVVLSVIGLVGAASVAAACDGTYSSTPKATAENAASTGTSASACSPGKTAVSGCGPSKMAKAVEMECQYCNFLADLSATADQVRFEVANTETGVHLVFTAVSEDDLTTAQAVASQAYSLMSAPAYCSMSRSAMARKCCDGCAEVVNAFAETEISIENTENGARTHVVSKDAKKVAKLQKMFASLRPVEEIKAAG